MDSGLLLDSGEILSSVSVRLTAVDMDVLSYIVIFHFRIIFERWKEFRKACRFLMEQYANGDEIC